MVNHPNRSKHRTPAQRPDPSAIVAARRAAGLDRQQAADLIYGTESAWKAWESGDRPMHAGLWELFKLKTGDREVMRQLGLLRDYFRSEPVVEYGFARSRPPTGHTGQ